MGLDGNSHIRYSHIRYLTRVGGYTEQDVFYLYKIVPKYHR